MSSKIIYEFIKEKCTLEYYNQNFKILYDTNGVVYRSYGYDAFLEFQKLQLSAHRYYGTHKQLQFLLDLINSIEDDMISFCNTTPVGKTFQNNVNLMVFLLNGKLTFL